MIFFDYVRLYAAIHGKPVPPETDHAYLNLAYINSSGLQVLSAGLFNITDEENALNIPIQTTMMHYQSRDGLKDIVTASSFVMLMAFNETENSIFGQSPDKNDQLFASFSLGYDLDELFEESKPDLNTKTETIPLTSSADGLTWNWGMKYTDLAAFWWQTSIDPQNPHRDPRPIALTIYDELTFTYQLDIDPETGEATLSTNYVIGKMRDLWLFQWVLLIIPITAHFNATGCYWPNGQKISDETIYQFLDNQQIKMSTVSFQGTVILDHSAYFEAEGVNVHDNEVDVDGSSIETFQTTTRTTKIAGFATNPIFVVHTSLMRLIPAVMASIDLELYQQAKDHLLDMNYADYFYVTSYPEYNGYRIEHDPTITAYCNIQIDEPTPQDTTPTSGNVGIVVLVVALLGIIGLVLVLKRRK